jgi:hypothetical protein
MASTLQVDDIQNTSGTNLLVNGYPRMPGQIIEVVTSPCDGSAVVAGSGTYTVGNVTAIQTLTASYADITGSSISYTPPTGTTRVRYILQYNFYWPNSGTHCISHHKFFLDGAEVIYARHNRSAVYPEGRYSFEWTVAIGGTPNANTGRIATWSGAKIMKMQSRFYAAGNPISLHGTNYWDGAQSVQLGIPVITVMAIA